ncbi:MAG: flagellar type III secretion system pore protein FliP [Planctomycetota bacterium]
MRCLTVVLTLLLCLAVAGSVQAQSGSKTSPGTGAQPNPTIGGQATNPQGQNPGSQGPSISLNLSAGSTSRKSLGSAIEIVLLMTLLALAPAIMLTMTCFTRIVIVLSFLKRAMSMQDLPPAVVVTGFSLFMTIFIMKPVISDIYENAYMPYVEEKEGVTLLTAADQASQRLSRFMLRQTREADLQLILDLTGAKTRPNTPADTPFHVVVPAFILSEIKTAFQMGFVLFLPFVIIDLVIASLLVSMGMFTLPPIVVSTPMKLLLFVMVDGWGLVVGSLAQSFGYQP